MVVTAVVAPPPRELFRISFSSALSTSHTAAPQRPFHRPPGNSRLAGLLPDSNVIQRVEIAESSVKRAFRGVCPPSFPLHLTTRQRIREAAAESSSSWSLGGYAVSIRSDFRSTASLPPRQPQRICPPVATARPCEFCVRGLDPCDTVDVIQSVPFHKLPPLPRQPAGADPPAPPFAFSRLHFTSSPPRKYTTPSESLTPNFPPPSGETSAEGLPR